MPNKPTPYDGPNPRRISSKSDLDKALKQLLGGMTLCVADHYKTGLVLLQKLDEHLGPPPNRKSHVALRRFKNRKRKLASLLLVPIRNHRVGIQGVPQNGFYAMLYPELTFFMLPFVSIQELHGAWKDFHQGLHFNVLGHRIHPYYGTYCPTRTEHLELFATWLSQYKGPKTTAIDVGTGTGILALLLQRAGFQNITASDHNPNAIESVTREIERHSKPNNITMVTQDLLGETASQFELIVFNPPWMKGEAQSLIDQGMYYTGDLFERFFDQCERDLSPGGRIVLVYSNIQSLVQPDIPHPIMAELDKGRFTLLQKMKRRLKPQKGHKRTKERCEIWELTHTS